MNIRLDPDAAADLEAVRRELEARRRAYDPDANVAATDAVAFALHFARRKKNQLVQLAPVEFLRARSARKNKGGRPTTAPKAGPDPEPET